LVDSTIVLKFAFARSETIGYVVWIRVENDTLARSAEEESVD